MNFFTNAGAFLNRQISNARNFVFPRPPIARASQPTLTAPHQNTGLVQAKQSQKVGFFGRISRGIRTARDSAVQVFDRAKVGFKSIFVPKEIKTIQNEVKKSASELAVTGIRTLSSLLEKKIGGIGHSGTPVDNRPQVLDRSLPVKNEGTPNVFGGFDFPFLGSSPVFGSPIPTVPDTEAPPVASSSSVVTPQQSSSSNILILLAIGFLVFTVFKGRK